MTIKELFDKAENGTLTYDQFVVAMGEAKFVDLSEGKYVDKQKYTDDLAARDTRITSLNETITSRDTDLATLQEQLKAAGTDTAKLEELNKNFTDLQGKYEKDTKAYQKQLKEQAYKYAVNNFANQQKFTSNAAKRDFVNSMMAKNLQMENDTIIGATDFMGAYAKENADAFATNNDNHGNGKPSFSTGGTGGNEGGNSGGTPFQFHFTGVRPHKD